MTQNGHHCQVYSFRALCGKATVLTVAIATRNYTGDVLNFGLAKEQHAALHPAKSDRIRFVIVGDDVAVGKTQGSIVGRRFVSPSLSHTYVSIDLSAHRGLAGTVLVYKIAGALAERGASLDQVHDIAQWVASRIVTIGVALEHCHVRNLAKSERGRIELTFISPDPWHSAGLLSPLSGGT